MKLSVLTKKEAADLTEHFQNRGPREFQSCQFNRSLLVDLDPLNKCSVFQTPSSPSFPPYTLLQDGFPGMRAHVTQG